MADDRTSRRAALYLRISLDKTGEELAVQRQREDCEQLAQRRGWTVAEEFPENSVSASGKVARPKFAAMLDAIKAGEITAVVAWSLDRLTRNARDRLALVEACQRHGVVIALVRGNDLDPTTPAGRLVIGILGEVAQHEIEQKGDRQRRAAQQSAERGNPPAGPLPFGFLPDRLSHHPEQAAAIRQAYADLLTGSTLAAIARRWNAAGLLSGRHRRGRIDTGAPSLWRAETVRALLLNPRNAGLRAHNGKIVGEAAWEPIVPEEDFYAIKRLLTDPDRRQASPAPRRLMSGVALCGVCGAPMVAGSVRPAGESAPSYHTYRCGRAGRHVARRGDHVDAFIGGGVVEGEELRGVVVERLSRADAIDLLPTDGGPDLPALRDRAHTLREHLDKIADEFGDDPDTDPREYRRMRQSARERLAAVEAEMADAARTSVVAPLVTADDVEAAWAAMDTHQRRAVIDTLMRVVLLPPGSGARRFDPDSVKIEWKGSAG